MEQELSLMAATRQLLKDRSEETTFLRIYKDLGIPPGWTQKFIAGGIPNPSVNRVQALYEHLSGKKLIV